MRKNKIDIISLGCSKNLVDSEHLMRQFQAAGYHVAHNASRVDGETVVVNTCGFIADASKSLSTPSCNWARPSARAASAT